MSADVEGWRAAMQLEIDLFDKFRVYDVVDRPHGGECDFVALGFCSKS